MEWLLQMSHRPGTMGNLQELQKSYSLQCALPIQKKLLVCIPVFVILRLCPSCGCTFLGMKFVFVTSIVTVTSFLVIASAACLRPFFRPI